MCAKRGLAFAWAFDTKSANKAGERQLVMLEEVRCPVTEGTC